MSEEADALRREASTYRRLISASADTATILILEEMIEAVEARLREIEPPARRTG